MPKTPEQKIIELEAKVKLLEKQKSFLEQQEYKINIRKNLQPEQSTNLDKKNKNQKRSPVICSG